MTEESNVMPFDFLHPKEVGDQKQINMALLECQRKYPSIPKNGKGKVQGRSKSGSDYSYEYRYAKFDDIMDAVRPILNGHGIFISQLPFPCLVDRNLYIITSLTHAESGGKKMAYFPVCDYTDARQQEIGGNQTYAKRYSLVVLGIVLEEDIDAQYTDSRTATRNGKVTRNPVSQVAPQVTEQVHDPETGEVKQDSKVIARSFYDDIMSEKRIAAELNVIAELVDKRLESDEIRKAQHETLHKVLHARKMIMGSRSFEDLDRTREAIDAVPDYFRKDGKLDEFLKAKEVEITATAVTKV